MKRILATIALTVALAVAAFAEGPHISFPDGTSVDLGIFPTNIVREDSIRYVNDGTEPVSIVRVFSECGCTVADYDTRPLAPGDTAVIRVRFDAKDRLPGGFIKAVRLRTSSGQNSVFVVKGRIERPTRR